MLVYFEMDHFELYLGNVRNYIDILKHLFSCFLVLPVSCFSIRNQIPWNYRLFYKSLTRDGGIH